MTYRPRLPANPHKSVHLLHLRLYLKLPFLRRSAHLLMSLNLRHLYLEPKDAALSLCTQSSRSDC